MAEAREFASGAPGHGRDPAVGPRGLEAQVLPYPGTPQFRPRRAWFQPSGSLEAFVFLLEGRRFQPRVGRPGGGPAWAPLGCPGESSQFSIRIPPPTLPMDR